MTALQITIDTAGQLGVNPRIVKVLCDDSLAEVTAAGFLNPQNLSGIGSIIPTDLVLVKYTDDVGFFKPTISGGVITLSSVTADVELPTTLNHIATFANTGGGIKNGSAVAINAGNIQAGLSGTAGRFISYPTTAAKGTLQLKAVDNSANFDLTLSNAATIGQATTIIIPDPSGSSAAMVVAPSALVSNNLVKASGTVGLVVDAGYRVIANTTAVWGGGGTTHQFAAVGLTAASKVVPNLRTSANVVAVRVVPGTDVLDATFSADPGAGTSLDYIATTAAVTGV